MGRLLNTSGLELVGLLDDAVESLVANDETKKRYQSLSGNVVKLYKAIMSEFIVDKSADGYGNIMNYFKEFVLDVEHINKASIKNCFQGIRAEFLIKSLGWYIDSKSIASFGASSKYISCIKEYFVYIIDNEYIENNELMSEFGYPAYSDKSFRYKVNHYLAENPSISKGPGYDLFDLETIKDLISECDKTLNDDYILSRVNKMQIYYNKYRSALMIKLIIYTGIAYRIIPTISLCDLDVQHCSITINGLTVHLPNRIIDQFAKYLEIRESLLTSKCKQNSKLFIEYDCDDLSHLTTTVSGFLKDLTGRGDLTGLLKYSITNMIKRGINQSIIMKFTNVKDTIYNWCQSEVNKYMDMQSSKYLDSKLRSLDVFDLL